MKKISMKQLGVVLICLFLGSPSLSFGNWPEKLNAVNGKSIASNASFEQEYHDAYVVGNDPLDNDVRSIAVDQQGDVWIAAASGVFRKKKESRIFELVIAGDDRGPAYSIAIEPNGVVLMGTWNGLYQFQNKQLKKIEEPKPPISVIASNGNHIFALGPLGMWQSDQNNWVELKVNIARSVRDAIVDEQGRLLIATDVGLYVYENGQAALYQDTKELISCYVNSLSFAPDNKIWAGVLGGVSIRENNKLVKNLTPEDGIPSIFVSSIDQSPDGVMWVGTNVGVVRYDQHGNHSLRFSKRWLMNDQVNDVAFDTDGTAWIATDGGVSAIRKRTMTLASKQEYFYKQLMTKHMREPWICGNLRLEVPGDTSTWQNSDDDNDGEFTGGYLSMESFRYAVTHDEDARTKARKAFHFLRKLREVTGTDGLFARTIVPADWTEVHDPNRTYTSRELAEELVKDPRYKPVEERWRLSKDGKWLWKGDTSSDEMCGHLMSYFFFYEYCADENDKKEIRAHVSDIVDGLITHHYNFIDIDGTHTRWGVWSPDNLNNDPDWASEKSINSFEVLAYLKFAAHITQKSKYEKEYQRLIHEKHYLENASHLNQKNPAWQIYFDRTMEGYLFPMLLKYEEDQKLKQFYTNLADEWMDKQPAGENLINNLTYALGTGQFVNTEQTIDFLKDAPLDLVDWRIDHTLREDVELVHKPILEELQISELPPASMRGTVRWDKNPWAAISGNPSQVREPVFWLWPYWMARYLGIIQGNSNQ